MPFKPIDGAPQPRQRRDIRRGPRADDIAAAAGELRDLTQKQREASTRLDVLLADAARDGMTITSLAATSLLSRQTLYKAITRGRDHVAPRLDVKAAQDPGPRKRVKALDTLAAPVTPVDRFGWTCQACGETTSTGQPGLYCEPCATRIRQDHATREEALRLKRNAGKRASRDRRRSA